jgi:hypothetical protein
MYEAEKGNPMLSILADTFRIATFTDRPWLHDSMQREPRTAAQVARQWFWRGRCWQAPDHRQ